MTTRQRVKPWGPYPVTHETDEDREKRLHRALADALRDYRNVYGVAQTRLSVLSQMYVLGIVEIGDSLALALGQAHETAKEKDAT